MKNTLILLGSILLFLSSCNGPEEYHIKGDLTGFPDGTKFFLHNVQSDQASDTSVLMDGKMELRGHLINQPERLLLIGEYDNQTAYVSLLINNEKVYIKGDRDDFPWKLDVKASADQEELMLYNSLVYPMEHKKDSLIRYYTSLSPEMKSLKSDEIWPEISATDSSLNAIRQEFTKSHSNSYLGAIMLYDMKMSLPTDTLRLYYNKLPQEIKESKYGTMIKTFLNEKPIEKGDHFYDFQAIDQYGDSIKLSNLTDKYILLEFTSAYCGPCKQAVKEMKIIDTLYSEKLTSLSFSTDPNKAVWLNTVEKEDISWQYLWDGKGNHSETYIKYGVVGIPTFFLIEPGGRVADVWVGYTDGSLGTKLEQYLN